MSWGNPKTLPEHLLAGLLTPAATGYGIGSYLRLKAYGKEFLKQERFPVPVISVGNVTVGGTGKTPVTIDLARRLVQAGRKVAILSRGYKRKSKEEFVVVSDGAGYFATAEDAGDEPYMMARAVPSAIVLVGSKRITTAHMAISTYGADVLLLDDGFQHLPIARDHDVVLLDYNDDPERDLLLPAGRWREPVSAIARGHTIVISKVPTNPDAERMAAFDRVINKYAPNAQRTTCSLEPKRLTPFASGDVTLNPRELKGLKVTAFCGIARPESFFDQLKELGAEVVGQRTFPDHHWYRENDMRLIKCDAELEKADLVVTTQKDACRLTTEMTAGLALSVLEMGVSWQGEVPIISSIQSMGNASQVRAGD
jgi:tetraacyldisaccharide 4'-kinase